MTGHTAQSRASLRAVLGAGVVACVLAGVVEARELSGRDARTILSDGRILSSGVGNPPPWVDAGDASPHLYLVVVYDEVVYFCNIGASNRGNRADLTCRQDAR